MEPTLDQLAGRPGELRAALEAGDPATLMLVLVQLTGDRHWLDAARPYIRGPMDYQATLPPELAAQIRDHLCKALLDYRESGRPLPPLPEDELLQAMLSTAAGETVGDQYLALMREELDTRAAGDIAVWRAPESPRPPAGFRVAIIGGGVSGICAAIQLQLAGIDYTIIEKNADFGGTWLENRYPGCGVDTPNHFYSFSFEPNPDWSWFFARQGEISQYLSDVAAKHRLAANTRFGVEVEAARFDEIHNCWQLTLDNGECLSANVVVSAVGVLNRPKWPDIPGREAFTGPAMHTAAWQEDFNWRGQRIGLIGTGASGQQVGPRLAPDAGRLTVFQRSPHWVVPNPNYFAQVSQGKKWLLAHLPWYGRWYRFQLFWAFADGIYPALQKDPDWAHPERSVNAVNDRHRNFMLRYLRKEIGDDPELLAKVTPDYPPYGKRILIDNHWFRMLKRDNVELETGNIERIESNGIRMRDGSFHELDALVFATGFHASRMLWPMRVVGRDGRQLADYWGADDARAHKGTTVPGFPNFFILTGPNTGLAHGGNQIFMTECQVRYLMLALRDLLTRGADFVEVREPVYERFNQTVDARHDNMVWTHRGMSNWYRNPQGRVFAISPWRLVEFWRMTRHFDPREHRFG
ncbi:MAG: monooxygenase [Salinisphaeraceae bacterium]|nr:monooxygenase [Salinisphaeraceae bacterium]